MEEADLLKLADETTAISRRYLIWFVLTTIIVIGGTSLAVNYQQYWVGVLEYLIVLKFSFVSIEMAKNPLLSKKMFNGYFFSQEELTKIYQKCFSHSHKDIIEQRDALNEINSELRELNRKLNRENAKLLKEIERLKKGGETATE